MMDAIYRATIRSADGGLTHLLTVGESRGDVANRLREEGHDVRQVIEASYKVVPFDGAAVWD